MFHRPDEKSNTLTEGKEKVRDLSQEGKITVRYQLMAMARDILTISAVLGVLGSGFWFVVKPYLDPFLELPTKVAEINARLMPLARPHLVEFNGHAMILSSKTIPQGGSLRLLFHLRRNADCSTDVDHAFINVDTGARIAGETVRAVQAPVTEDFTSFILSIKVPIFLPAGRYTYFPRIVPINCGIYQPYNGAMSDVFEVKYEQL
jgi:hypothetical protein